MQSLRKLFEKTWHSSQVVKCFVFLRIFRIIFFSNQYCIGCSLSWKRNCYEVHWKFKIIPTLFFYFSFLKTVLLQTFASILTNSSNFSVNMCTVHCVKSEVSKYGVFSGPYFPVFGLNTEIYFVFTLCPYLDTFHAVVIFQNISSCVWSRWTYFEIYSHLIFVFKTLWVQIF